MVMLTVSWNIQNDYILSNQVEYSVLKIQIVWFIRKIKGIVPNSFANFSLVVLKPVLSVWCWNACIKYIVTYLHYCAYWNINVWQNKIIRNIACLLYNFLCIKFVEKKINSFSNFLHYLWLQTILSI